MFLKIYLLKYQDLLKKKNKSQLENIIAERVKWMKPKKSHDKDLTDTSILEGDDSD